MRVVVTGGCGYIGSVLVPKLLAAGHQVSVIDIQWFGNYLQKHPNLKVIKADIREPNLPLDCDALIHLAAVANDPTGDIDPKLTWGVNALGTMNLIDQFSMTGFNQFIYASSGSVYGVSNEPEVVETLPLVPLSEYNKTKMVAERVVLSYADRMAVQILRPATVCGVSPRQRLDVAVNAITISGLENGVVHFNGGEQVRPNIHIEDMTDLYLWMLDRSHVRGIYNAGFENLEIRQIASMVSERLNVKAISTPTRDHRSYRQNSDKLLKAGFKPKHTVSEAIDDLIKSYQAGRLRNLPEWHNLHTMKERRAA